ncbi:efflux RND transporter periplasmic adaptor subunit [Alkalilacustris brevis]|uniref:efflux RND transporter periplasmic adaptor subunit n=1 Tax=Alkalilacustris brevis TaxID=2026338 RepID=UPI000E0D0DF5|nr:efflux RND transporter periplasmic adaptor subunit [Alkalilacustris brevis]
MRIISLLTASLVLFTLYLLVLERDALFDFAEGDPSALGRIAVVQWITGAPDTNTALPVPEPTTETTPPAADAPPAEDTPERRVAVVAMPSQAQQIERAVILRGRTEAARQVQVMAETSGRVISEPLPRGSMVESGDTLCQLAPGTRAATLDEARARLTEAEISFRAAQQLATEGFASDTRAANARAALQTAQAAVARAEEEIERLTITAPFGGVLETDSAELGALMQPGALCATVVQLDPIRLVGFVPEADIDRIEHGAPAGARLVSGREVQGEVTFLARSADPGTRTFRVEVTVANPDLGIRDGQTAEIAIAAAGAEAHLLPGSALTLDDDGRLGVRIVDEERRARFVPVEVVRDSINGVWVSGLPAAADVIIVGQEFVRDGVSVAPTWREAPLDDGTGGANPLAATITGIAPPPAGSGAVSEADQ